MGAATHTTPRTLLVVNGTPLDPFTSELVQDITLEATCDGADVLTLTCDAWDPEKADWRVLDERGLFPGNFVELWSGYGEVDRCHGLFRIMDREPDYSRQPRVVFKAYDGLQRLMEHTESRVLRGFKRDSDMIEYLCREKWGFATDAVPTPGTMPPGAPLASTLRPAEERRRAVHQTPPKTGDRVKPLGITDLAWVKQITEAYGWMYPKVRYRASSPYRKAGPAIGPTEEGVEVFVFKPAATDADEWTQTLWVRKPGCPDGQLDSFTPKWSIANAPTGVQILGWDRRTHKPIRVTARLRGPTLAPEVTLDSDVEVDEKIEGEIRTGAALRLSTLGSGKRVATLVATTLAGQKWSPQKEVPDVLTSSMVKAPDSVTPEEIAEMAKAYLRMRLSAWWTADWSMKNVPGSHRFDSDQIHEIKGCAHIDEGKFILLKAAHHWTRHDHDVACHGQKLIDASDLDARTAEEVFG